MLAYVLVLSVAEAAWCHAGLRRLREPAGSVSVLRALSLGLVRLLIGRAIVIVTGYLVVGVSEWVIYGLVLLPLRWLAWSFIAELIAGGRVRLVVLPAGNRKSNLWVLGGTLLCCAADLVAFLNGIWAGHLWP